MNEAQQPTYGAPSTAQAILLESERVAQMRAVLHELANVMTGILMSGGLLAQRLDGRAEADYAQKLCELGERGSSLVQHTRALLLGAFATGLNTLGQRGAKNVGQ